MKIKSVTKEEWITDLNSFNYSLFIAPEWVDAMAELNSVPLYLNFYNTSGDCVAKISGLIISGGIIKGKQLYFYAGPGYIYNTEELNEKCLLSLYDYAKKNRYSRVYVDCHDYFNGFDWSKKVYQPIRYSEFIIDMKNNDIDKLITRNIKYNIRKAVKNNAIFIHDNSKNRLKRLIELINYTRKIRNPKYGNAYNPFPYVNFKEGSLNLLLERGIANLYSADINGVAHSMLITIERKDRVFGLIIAADEVAYKNGLQPFIFYNCIKHFEKMGFRYFNVAGALGGNDGLARFKNSMGFRREREYGVDSYFIDYPRRFLNPFLIYGKKMPENSFLNFFKRIFSKVLLNQR